VPGCKRVDAGQALVSPYAAFRWQSLTPFMLWGNISAAPSTLLPRPLTHLFPGRSGECRRKTRGRHGQVLEQESSSGAGVAPLYFVRFNCGAGKRENREFRVCSSARCCRVRHCHDFTLPQRFVSIPQAELPQKHSEIGSLARFFVNRSRYASCTCP
jgi:hypothetical protein